MYRILVSDPLEKTGLAMLRESGHEVVEIAAEERAAKLPELIAGADALVVRSGTQVTADLLRAGVKLKVVGRAGIGVDNIDTETATELGILVINAPTANLLAATEHTFALMLAVARNVAAADADVKSERWNRKQWVGTELQGKTLGVVGFGRIGRQVALRARAFEMRVVAFDPFLDADFVRRENAEPMALDELLAAADVVTLHVPMTDETRGLIDGRRIGLMKPEAILINCARGGVVDEAALLSALESGHLKGAGIDVFAKEPPPDYTLARHPRVVATPHLGAQTHEAQLRISTETAKMVLAALDGSLAVTAVNLPFRSAGMASEPYLRLAEKQGLLASSLGPSSVKRIAVEVRGISADLGRPIAVAALKGALSRYLGEGVNYVNAERVARDRGLEVVQSTTSDADDYPNLVEVRLEGDKGAFEVAGTVFQDREPRIVRMQRYLLEFVPKGTLLILRNADVPGVVGKLGTILGEAGVNIAAIHLSRGSDDREAAAVLRLDEEPSEETLATLRALPEVRSATLVDVGPL
jgi:D-3-phosphoglycerate dehydrogenase / 2-oxoglutarate reductase